MAIRSLALTRAVIGLLQGVFLWLLYQAVETQSWPATDPSALAAMAIAGSAVPLLAIIGLGNLRPRTLGPWLVAATLICIGIAAHGVYRESPLSTGFFAWGAARGLVIIFFILQSLITASDADRRIVAAYPRYFDVAWKLGVQLALALLFLGALWGLLWLGAGLFDLIKISLFRELIQKSWFAIPVSMLALACSIHVTDVRANLVTGARTLILALMSWLLPVMTIFAVLFLVAVPFAGLDLLWATRRATSSLLGSVVALVFLINATYQDGRTEAPIALLLRQSRWLAAIVLVPLTWLAGYGLMLRVQQYGFSPARVVTAAIVAVAVCYAAGYALAAIVSRLALKELEPTNVLASWIIVVVWLAMLTPVADPAEISVANQVARLNAGRTTAEKFDWGFLRFQAGRYGSDALHRLADGAEIPQQALVAERARVALRAENQSQLQFQGAAMPATSASRADNITVIQPPGAKLPESFLQADWTKARPPWPMPGCLVRNATCEAVLVDLDGDGHDEILLFNLPADPGTAFQSDGEGRWNILGTLGNSGCPGVREALRAGKFEAVTPAMKEVEVAGQRVIVNSGCRQAARSN